MDRAGAVLQQFHPISLKEMDGVKLMDRCDTKFLFSLNRLPEILQELSGNYKVLEVEGKRISGYDSQYFDLPGFDLYHQHHRGRLPRFKVRKRVYLETGLGFLEVKNKNNKGRTKKNRIPSPSGNAVFSSAPDRELVFSHTGLDPGNLMPVVKVFYSRITLVNQAGAERVTLDMNLRFSGNSREHHVPQLVIAEVKQDRNNRSFFTRLMQKHGIREGRVSKYCWALISLYQDIPHNRFKTIIRNISKITHGTTSDSA